VAEVGSIVRRVVVRFAIALAVSTLMMGGGVFAVNYIINDKLDSVTRIKVATAPEPPQGANYLVIGSDSRAFTANDPAAQAEFGNSQDTGGQRSDTIMVVHVLPQSKRTLIVSIPRDLWVRIPNKGMSKINAAFDAGPDTLIQTLKENFGIEINHYLQVDFKSFQGVVNAIGTVPVYFPYKTYDDYTGLDVNAGCIKLNGEQSLAYVRARYLQYYGKNNQLVDADILPDIGRIARQQTFIRTLAGIAVAKSLTNPLTANSVGNEVLKNLTIDKGLTKDGIFSIINAFRTINANDTSALDFETLPYKTGDLQNGQSVLYPATGWQDLAARLEDFTPQSAPAMVTPSAISLQVVNATDRAGIGEATTEELVRLGFRTVPATTETRKVALSEVHYAPGAVQKGTFLLDYLDPAARLVADSTLKGVDVKIVLGTDFKAILRPAGSEVTPTTIAGTPTTSTTTPAAPTTTTTTAPAATTPTGISPIAFGQNAILRQSELGPPAPPCT
jgi:LCP family protein required for cell wall assembly